MDRINKLGKELIEYKQEYSKHYSPIVDRSLEVSLESQISKDLINRDIFNMIINDTISNESFTSYIENQRKYIKSEKELVEEFDKIRDIVNNSLIKIDFIEGIETENNIEANKISILKQYTFTADFLKTYFGLEDSDMKEFMARRGFAENFSKLRLIKIFKEIFSEMRVEIEFVQSFSKVYFNQELNGFSIDYKYNLNANYITEENIEAKVRKVKEVDKVVENKFNKKSGISFYDIASKKVKEEKKNFNVPKNAPNNKMADYTEEKIDLKPEIIKPVVKQEVKPEFKPEIKSEIKQELKPESKPEIKKFEPKKEDLDKDDTFTILEEVSNIKIEEDFSEEYDLPSFDELSKIDLSNIDELELPDLGDLDFDTDSF